MKRILVPLDGSQLAERALVIAADLAEGLSGTLVTARVVPAAVAGRYYAPNLIEQMQEAQTKEATEYIEGVAQRLRADRLEVETHVLTGDAAGAIVRLAGEQRCDLIIMGSHGMGGLGSKVFGSVAMKVLHESPVPVMIARSTPDEVEREEEQEESAADAALLREMPQSKRGGSGA